MSENHSWGDRAMMEWLSNDLINAVVLVSNFVLIPALAYGSQLALGALGITLVYGVLRFSNFAHGDTMAFGTMAVILVTWWFQSMGIGFGPLPTALLALPFGILAAGALCLVFDRFVYRHYRRQKSPPVVYVIASVGVMFMILVVVLVVRPTGIFKGKVV